MHNMLVDCLCYIFGISSGMQGDLIVELKVRFYENNYMSACFGHAAYSYVTDPFRGNVTDIFAFPIVLL